jgi:DNA-3-methyladenine glycosylase I
MARERCPWAEGSPLEAQYHDREWGVPLHDDRVLFEFLTLEGAQAGLSWRTILNKRENYRALFLDYDIDRLARLDDAALEQRLLDPGIVRNRLKVWSVRSNARAALDAIADVGSLDALLWSFVDGVPLQGKRRAPGDVPASTPVSDAMSKALAKRGFKFVGSTIMYAFMQATGMVNDHLHDCPRHAACARLR